MRAETLRQTTDYTRQADKLADAQRRLDSADSTERAMRTQLKTAEANIHKMKDEMHKMKTLVAQTRSSCANEVRKRDRQIEALKKTVTEAARVRGGARSRDVVTISVTGDYGSEHSGAPMGATTDAEYSLRMETNEFLTRLARGLSEENEGLVNIVRQTVDSLREMAGLEADLKDGSSATKGAEELATELETIIDHLRNILTNPSFVPIEELELRDEEIRRLRLGFEKMEARWKDAVRMIDGWRRRMGSEGKTVDMEELSIGLRLSPVRIRDIVDGDSSRAEPMELSCVQEEEEEEEEAAPSRVSPARLRHVVIQRTRSPSPVPVVSTSEELDEQEAEMQYGEEEDADEDSDVSSIYDDDLPEVDEVDEPNFEVLQVSTATTVSSPPLPERPQLSPLKDSFSAGNKMPSEERQQPSRKRAAADTLIVPDEPTVKAVAVSSTDNKKREKREPVPPSRTTRLAARRSLEKSAEKFEVAYESPHFGKSSEKVAELRLFSKPAAPLDLQGKDKGKAGGGATGSSARNKAGQTTASVVSSARPTRGRAAAAAAAQKPDGPAEKKLRRSLPESETEDVGGASVTTTVSTPELSPAPEKPSQNSKTNAVNLGPRPSAQEQSRTRSPVRPQGDARLPPPRRKNPVVPQSPLTMEAITAKLAASEREADAARVRAKLKAARLGQRRAGGTSPRPAAEASPAKATTLSPMTTVSPEKPQDPVKKPVPSPIRLVEPEIDEQPELVAPAVKADRDIPDELAEFDDYHRGGGMSPKIEVIKRKRERRLSQATNRRASRRRSTLSPWELEGLITGNVGPPSPTRG